MYDAGLDAWIQKAPFPGTPRSGAVAWTIEKGIDHPLGYIALGEDNLNQFKNDVWEYNYNTNSWIQRSDFPSSGRKNAVAFTIAGIAYVGTGYDGAFHDDFYAYSGTAGISEMTAENTLNFYPNPSHSLLQISGQKEALVGYSIYSLTGALMEESTFNQAGSYVIDLSNELKNPGIYMIQLKGNKKTYPLQKIILE